MKRISIQEHILGSISRGGTLRIVFGITTVVVLLLTGIAGAVTANLVSNPGFENWKDRTQYGWWNKTTGLFPEGWDVGRKWEAPLDFNPVNPVLYGIFPLGDARAITTNTTLAHSGSYAVQFTVPGYWDPPGPSPLPECDSNLGPMPQCYGYTIIKQDISGITPRTNYEFSFWAKLPVNDPGNRAYVWWTDGKGIPLGFPLHVPAIEIEIGDGPFDYKEFRGVTPPAPPDAVSAQLQFGRYGWNPTHIDDVYFAPTTRTKGIIEGIKFNDINGNGRRDPGENGLANWTIKIFGFDTTARTPVNNATTTDALGNYNFTNLTPGVYTVYEVIKPDFVATTLTASTVQIIANETVIVNFGNKKIR